jgi:hypothetical protein
VPHEISEQIEHAGHEHGSGPGAQLSKRIGVTIAILGVLMAVSSALVGATRTELIATMVEENGASLRYQSVSGKYRVLQGQLQQLRALMPDAKLMASTEEELKALEAGLSKDSPAAPAVKAVRLESKKILSSVIPTAGDVKRLAELIRRYRQEADVAKEWAESYHEAIHVHERSASRYEIGQLCAEIGIVIASVSLLFHARWAWYIAIGLGTLCLSIAAGTYVIDHRTLHSAEEDIKKHRDHFKEVSNDKKDVEEDEKLLKEILEEISSLGGAEGRPGPRPRPWDVALHAAGAEPVPARRSGR